MVKEVYKINWQDSCTSYHEWVLMEDLDTEITTIKMTSYGVMVNENAESVTIAQNYGENPSQICNLMTIPRGCITVIEIIDRIDIEQE